MQTERFAITPDERFWATVAHLITVVGYATVIGQYIAPLVIYLMFQDKSRFVAFHALQSLYFQLILLAAAIAGVCVAVLTCGLTAWLLLLLPAVSVVYALVVAFHAFDGAVYEYWLAGKWARRQVGI